MTRANPQPRIEVRHLTMAFGERVIQEDLDFAVGAGQIFVIMGDSGSGKSTLMRHMIGLQPPARGDVFYDGRGMWAGGDAPDPGLLTSFGVLFQNSALFSSMTLLENVALPLIEQLRVDRKRAHDIASFKLGLVGLSGYEEYHPWEISGGMRKRTGIARAMALDPEILYFDEPSAGLDPLTARRLDDLILELRESLGTTIVLVTHELASILSLGDDSVFLDSDEKRIIATGRPKDLVDEGQPKVRAFLRRERL